MYDVCCDSTCSVMLTFPVNFGCYTSPTRKLKYILLSVNLNDFNKLIFLEIVAKVLQHKTTVFKLRVHFFTTIFEDRDLLPDTNVILFFLTLQQ